MQKKPLLLSMFVFAFVMTVASAGRAEEPAKTPPPPSAGATSPQSEKAPDGKGDGKMCPHMKAGDCPCARKDGAGEGKDCPCAHMGKPGEGKDCPHMKAGDCPCARKDGAGEGKDCPCMKGKAGEGKGRPNMKNKKTGEGPKPDKRP